MTSTVACSVRLLYVSDERLNVLNVMQLIQYEADTTVAITTTIFIILFRTQLITHVTNAFRHLENHLTTNYPTRDNRTITYTKTSPVQSFLSL